MNYAIAKQYNVASTLPILLDIADINVELQGDILIQ